MERHQYVPHFFFDDDLFLFAHATREDVESVKNCMLDFCDVSGQRDNFNETKIFFSKNIHRDIKRDICDLLMVGGNRELGKIFGLSSPLKDERQKMDGLMYKAAKEGNMEFLKTFVELEKTNKEEQQQNHHLMLVTHQENNIIHIAAKFSGHQNFISLALQSCPSLAYQKNSRGDTPLHVAARAGHFNAVNVLLPFSLSNSISSNKFNDREMEEGGRGGEGEGEMLRMKNKAESTAFHEALRNGHEAVATVMWDIDHELAGDVNTAGESPLYLAAESRCKNLMGKMLCFLNKDDKNGCNKLLPAALCGPDGQNPLHAAVLAETIECITLLLGEEEKLKLINQPDKYGRTALHFATASKNTNIVAQLLEKDTYSAYLHDTKGRTPLLEATSSGNQIALKKILEYCPDSIELCDKSGRSALHLAVIYNCLSDVEHLLSMQEMRQLVNEPDSDGNTPLHLATKNQNYKLVKRLMNIQCTDFRAKNNEGLTALDICESDWKLSFRQKYIYRCLKEHQAPRGRHPYNWKLNPEIKSAVDHPEADLKQMANTFSVVAALLATLTFAAAFTIPGGYTSDEDKNPMKGTAVLINKKSFKIFVVSDTVAMCSSMTVVFLMLMGMVGDPSFLRTAINYSKNLLNLALVGTMLAFITGLSVVLPEESLWLGILVCMMGFTVPFLVQFLSHKSSTSTPLFRILKGAVKQPARSSTLGTLIQKRPSHISIYERFSPNPYRTI